MKPIQLKLAGLQSYREEQVIDFSQLCDAGVFGIFGPTGSGKSSILDAITLALYARVERANNGTQGIMNHAEDALSVSFTFELTNATETKRFRVERQFKRLNDVSISNTLSRFIDMLPDGDVVLADKHGDVNDAVQQLLGLSVDDFTRAVVLPQGKFAEFLYLKGSERRQMLQRLFNLEKFGDLLQMKLNQLARQADVESKQLSAEQQGLGDASEAAVKAAKEELQQADELATQQRKQLTEQEQQFKHAQQVWDWQTQKANDEQRLQQLTASLPDIVALERKVEQAEQAERLRPYVDQWDAAFIQLEQSSTQLEHVNVEQAEAKRQYDVASEAYESAEQQRQANEASLLIKLNDYEQALHLEKELHPLGTVLAEQEEAYKASDALAKQQAERLQEEQDLLHQARLAHKALQKQLEQYDVPAATVRNMQAAHHEKQAMDKLELDHKKLMNDQQQQADAMTNKKQEIATIQQQYEQGEMKIQQATSTLVQAWHQLHDHQSALHSLTQRAEQTLHLLQTHDEQHALQQQAAHLAQHLDDGAACPVCGSLEHPEPAVALETTEHYAQPKALQALLTSLRDHDYELKQIDFTIRTQLKSVTTSTLPEPFVMDQTDEQNESLDHANDSHMMSVAYSENLQSELSDLREKINDLKLNVNEQSTTMTTVQQQLDDVIKRLNEQTSELKALEAVLESMRDKAQGTAGELERMKASWHERYADYSLEEIDAAFAQIETNEKRADELKEQLKQSEQTIQQMEQSIQQSQQRLHEQEKELVQLDAQRDRTKEVHTEKSERLKQWIGNAGSAQHLIGETEQKLQQLLQAVKLAKAQFESRRQQLEAANSKLSAANQALTTAQATERDAKQQLEQHMASTPFETSEAVRQAFADEPTIRQWKERIKSHRDAEQQLSFQIKELEHKLAGEQVSEKEWEELQAALQLAKEQVEMAIQQKAKAERDLDDVLQRHERWAELEAKNKELRHYSDMLSKLQKVFRGNAFVEYVAEEQLIQVSRAASERLGDLTRQRYAIEVDSGGGFIIRDDANGGVRRPASSLSGGEAFLTSLSLALALSAQIQLGGQYALEFFFLDEGFGTLDQHMLEGVITALEKLHSEHLNVGVISHVPQLRAHLPRKLIVHPAEPSGRGSTVSLETI